MISKFFIEIRNRIFLNVITFLSVFCIIYIYKNFLMSLILITNTKFLLDMFDYFIYTSITEIFLVYIKLDFFLTSQIVYFMLFYHIICFFAYGTYKNEYRYLKYIYFISACLGILSIFFCNLIFIPFLLNFFLSFQDHSLQNISFYFEAKILDYLLFYINSQLGCFISFQICVILILFSNYLSKNIKILKNTRKIFYFILLVFCTLVTPPDIFSQIFLFLVLITGFEMLIFINILKKFIITVSN